MEKSSPSLLQLVTVSSLYSSNPFNYVKIEFSFTNFIQAEKK